MTPDQLTGPAAGRAGVTVIEARALRRFAEAVTAELMDVRASDVSVELADARGALAVSLATPFHAEPSRGIRGTLVERAATISDVLVERLATSAGRTVGRVDVRFSRIAAAKNAAAKSAGLKNDGPQKTEDRRVR